VIRFPRRNRDAKVSELRSLPVFAGLGRARLEELARNLDEAHVPAGQTLMQEGHHNDTFWIVLDGALELTVAGRAREVVGRGGVVGLPSMFTGRESSATVVTLSDVRALVASHAQFNNFIGDVEVEIRFKAAVFDRLRDEIYQLTHEPAAAAKPARKK
jgi:CRP-like cAMP-binding protein